MLQVAVVVLVADRVPLDEEGAKKERYLGHESHSRESRMNEF